MINLYFNCEKQILTRTDREDLASNSREIHTCNFTLSNDWDDMQITAVFKYMGCKWDVLMEDNTCIVPAEVLEGQEGFSVGLYGVKDDQVITSTLVTIPVSRGANVGGIAPVVTPSMFDQIMNKIDEIEEKVCPDITATATVDSTTGTPAVEVTKGGTETAPEYNFAFSGLKGPKGDPGNLGPVPVITAAATVDSTSGTPAVNVTKGGTDAAPEFTFAFSGLKGTKGDPGAPGAPGSVGPAPIVTAAATVDSTSGTPAVNVTKSGTDAAPQFNFAFSGLKGAAGAPGTPGTTPAITAAATVDSTSGTPAVNVTKSGTDAAPQFNFAFTGLKGAQGEPGTSYDDTEIRAEINDVWKAQGELGAKNLIPFPYLSGESYTINGITFTVNNDGSIVVNGTSTTYCTYFIARSIGALKHGSYILSNSELLPQKVDFQLGYYYNNAWVAKAVVDDQHKEALAEVTSEFDEKEIAVRIVVDPNATIDNLTIYPMLRLAADPDTTWQPHVPTNYELMQSDNALAEGLAKFGKKLWQGNFTSGSIEVAEAAKYSVILVYLTDSVLTIGTHYSGGGSYGTSGNYDMTQAGYRLAPASSGDNMIYSITETAKGGRKNGAQAAIIAIYGLF